MDLIRAISDIKRRIEESPKDISEADIKATQIEQYLLMLVSNAMKEDVLCRS